MYIAIALYVLATAGIFKSNYEYGDDTIDVVINIAVSLSWPVLVILYIVLPDFAVRFSNFMNR